MMDILLISLGLFCMFLGIVGSVVPVLPGAPISWLGLLLFFLAPSIPFSTPFIVITGIIALAIYILDYLIPAMGTKRFGGSKAGMWGTTIGLFVGLFTLGPLGILIGPFVGALVGELAFNNTESSQAFKAATGSFIGFLTSTFIKFITTVTFFGLFLYQVYKHWSLIS